MSLCRNGHDLAMTGRIVSDARGVYRRCLACRRAAKDRENAREKAKRAASGKGRKDVCRNGHPRSMSRRRSSGLRCLECDRVGSEHRRALAKEHKTPSGAGWQASGTLLADDGDAIGALNRMIGVPLWNYADGSEADHWPEVDFDWTTDEERMCMLEQLLVEFG